MSLGSQRDSALRGKPASASGKDSGRGATAWADRLRALFGRKEQPASDAEWLFTEANEADSGAALDPEGLSQDLENWRQDLAQIPEPIAPVSEEIAEIGGSLITQGLSKTYKGRKVIKDVSLRVQRGEAIGLLGPNGAGKTTLFYMITGLIRPDSGMILLEDYDVTALPMYRRARLGIGYLPQEPSIFRGLSVEKNILAVLEVTQPDKDKRREELESLLAEFKIARLRKLPGIALSGGERRRCEIARALAGHPSFMLLDEPFAGIDPIAIGEIRALVQHLTRRGIGVLITDHNVREALDLIDRGYIIHDGQLLTEGTPEKIIADPQVRRLYLGESFRL